MSIRLSILLAGVLSTVALEGQTQAPQAPLPPDINPVTLSRLPPPTPADLDEEAQRLLAARTNYTPGPGPGHVTVYSPRERSLGVPSGEKSPVGPRFFQLAVLIAAREIDQQYEWSAHEPASLRQGLEQSVLETEVTTAPMSGDGLFRARARLRLPAVVTPPTSAAGSSRWPASSWSISPSTTHEKAGCYLARGGAGNPFE